MIDHDRHGCDPDHLVHDHRLQRAHSFAAQSAAAWSRELNKESLGWLYGTWISHFTWIILFVGFGHSVLAMSGEETLAQVNREIEHPKLKNLEKTGLIIFVYSLLFTSLVSFFAVMIIPDQRPARLLRQPDRRNRDVPRRSHRVEADLPRIRGAGWRADSGGRAKYFHRGRQWRAESGGGRRRSDRLVPETAPKLRHQLSHDEFDCRVAIADHHPQPRQRLCAGGTVRLWRDLELRADVAGGAGAALQRARKPASGRSRAISTLSEKRSPSASLSFRSFCLSPLW